MQINLDFSKRDRRKLYKGAGLTRQSANCDKLSTFSHFVTCCGHFGRDLTVGTELAIYNVKTQNATTLQRNYADYVKIV